MTIDISGLVREVARQRARAFNPGGVAAAALLEGLNSYQRQKGLLEELALRKQEAARGAMMDELRMKQFEADKAREDAAATEKKQLANAEYAAEYGYTPEVPNYPAANKINDTFSLADIPALRRREIDMTGQTGPAALDLGIPKMEGPTTQEFMPTKAGERVPGYRELDRAQRADVATKKIEQNQPLIDARVAKLNLEKEKVKAIMSQRAGGRNVSLPSDEKYIAAKKYLRDSDMKQVAMTIKMLRDTYEPDPFTKKRPPEIEAKIKALQDKMTSATSDDWDPEPSRVADFLEREGPSGRAPVGPPPAKPQAKPAKQMTDVNLAKEYIKRAGGDKNKAREMAKADGWAF